MVSRLLEYLRQMKTAAQQSIHFIDQMSYADFQEDTKTQRAVTMNLVILGHPPRRLKNILQTS